MKSFFLFILFLSNNIFARDVGQTEITTDEGIEVFQKEKFYLLKKNVYIESDNFQLTADVVKAYFDKDLYDITKIESKGNVKLKSSKGLIADGSIINFSTKNENITVLGLNSSLIYNDINMFSNESIKLNNLTGDFNLKGVGSSLLTDSIEIYGSIIDGNYISIENVTEVQLLYVEDNVEANIKTETSNMFALKANYNKAENVIELFEKVKIIRDSEIITGDYAYIDTLNESYKIISNNKQKVKALISDTDE